MGAGDKLTTIEPYSQGENEGFAVIAGVSFCSSAFYVAQRRKELSLSFRGASSAFFKGVVRSAA